MQDVIFQWVKKTFKSVFEGQQRNDYWDAVNELVSLQIDELRKNNERKEKELQLSLKFETKISETIAGKGVEELLVLEKEIEKIFYGEEFTMESDYWDFLLMTVKRKRAVMMLGGFFEKVKKIEGHHRVYIREVNVKKEENNLNLELADEDYPKTEVTVPIKTENEFRQSVEKKRNENLHQILENKVEEVVLEETKNEVKTKKTVAKVMKDISSRNEDNLSENRSFLRQEEVKLLELDWVEAFRPRKPHFFNRVKLGYEWNYINILRYTKDNPPPREVVGYKFNIFFPGLLDKTSIPTFKLTPMDTPEFVIISFIAGPPYSKISFQIVNRQWDMANRKNFKCLFDKSVLHLYFDFAKQKHCR